MALHAVAIRPGGDPRGPDRQVAVRFRPVRLPVPSGPTLPLLGAWSVEVDDPRFGGESALVLDHGRLLALSDDAVLTRFPRPGAAGAATVHSLAEVNGDPAAKRDRDSEALVRDVAAHGWWVAFENRHAVAFYDEQWRRHSRIGLTHTGWTVNRGIESLLVAPGTLIAVAEQGDRLLQLRGTTVASAPITGADGDYVSDATRLPDGRIVAIVRRMTLLGFRNALAWLEPGAGGGWRLRRFARPPARPYDNFEGIAAEPLADGATRLWLITDNDGFRWRRTLLIALRLAPAAATIRPRPAS